MDTVDRCRCGEEAVYGCHGIVAGEIRSYDACTAHKSWEGSLDSMTEREEQAIEVRVFEQLLLLEATPHAG